MLKMKEALDFCEPMNEVGNDFMKHITDIRQPNNEVIGLEKEIFKWAFECKFSLFFFTRNGLLINICFIYYINFGVPDVRT